jgi:hypothetical protein
MEDLNLLNSIKPAPAVAKGKPGRPRGKKLIKKEQVKALTAAEKFQLLKKQLIKDLTAEDYDPRILKDIIEAKDRNLTITHHTQGGKLWAKLLLQRGKLREKKKDTAQVTIFDGIICRKFSDGLQFELPRGLSFREKKTGRVIELIDELEMWSSIGI